MSEFDEYIVHGEPGQREKADAWQTAIGLQDVDGLKPWEFFSGQTKATEIMKHPILSQNTNTQLNTFINEYQ